MPTHRTNCRHFDGNRPCPRSEDCLDCAAFEVPSQRVLIILFGRLGDVVAATSLATALAGQMPGTHLTWLTDADAAPFLVGHPAVHRVLAVGEASLLMLRVERFDLVVNLDRSLMACALTMQIDACRRVGFGYSAWGAVVPLDPATEMLFDINRHPPTRAANRRSWAELHYAIAGLDASRPVPLPSLVLSAEEEAAARDWRSRTVAIGESLVLCCIGSHANDPQKRWPTGHWRRLWTKLGRVPGVRPVVHAGPHEAAIHAELTSDLPHGTLDAGLATDLRVAMVRIRAADAVITGDSLALHLAIALRRPVVGLFGPTNPAFVQAGADTVLLRGKAECPPCHARSCPYVTGTEPRPCLSEITPETVESTLCGLILPAESGPGHVG